MRATAGARCCAGRWGLPRLRRCRVGLAGTALRTAQAAQPTGSFDFDELQAGFDETQHVAQTRDSWDILILAGDPQDEVAGAKWGAATSENGWFINPDNSKIDGSGRLWISTDGNSPEKSGRTDGLWAIETEGALRGSSKHFFRCPVGAELCGPYFVAGDETLFVAVQHPGDVDGSSYEQPATRWPDFDAGLPVRPSVVAITKPGGGKIG